MLLSKLKAQHSKQYWFHAIAEAIVTMLVVTIMCFLGSIN